MNFALFRLPYADTYTEIRSRHAARPLASLSDIGGRGGFVVAPFNMRAHRAVLIEPDEVKTGGVGLQTCDVTGGVGIPAYDDVIRRQESRSLRSKQCLRPQSHSNQVTRNSQLATCRRQGNSQLVTRNLPQASYAEAFRRYHEAVTRGQFRKLVLARRKDVACSGEAREMFLAACRAFPRLMIMLWSTAETGTWLVASPEILMEAHGTQCHTVALAGTMPWAEGYAAWSAKNRGEQHVVEQYIAQTLAPMSADMVMDGPVTMRAGNLCHLRTDFRFRRTVPLGTLLTALHPTPAVCGWPKAEAHRFILSNEGFDRRYYSGFAGPVDIGGETHLYVSLRCAELHPDHATLYAGGGIMPGSTCQSEWDETEQKMATIAEVTNYKLRVT